MSRVEGNIFFFQIVFFFEKVIIDSINVIKTNKKDFAGGEGGGEVE